MSDITSLLNNAAGNGDITPKTASLLTNAATLREIKKGDGVSAETFPHSAARIITILLDDSSSIEDNNNTQHLIDGHNQIIAGLCGSSKKQQLETIVSCRTLNNGPIYEYKHLADVPKLTRAKFSPNGSTPLFDQSIVTVGSVIAKVQEFENAGIAARTWTLIVSDGGDYGSQRKASDVATVVKELNSEQHLILAMGVSDGTTDFTKVFLSMGVKQPNIHVVNGKDPAALRRMFNQASQSAAGLASTAAPSSVGGLLD